MGAPAGHDSSPAGRKSVSGRRNITFVDVVRSLHTCALRALVPLGGAAVAAFAEPARSLLSPTNIFAPVSTPAQSIFDLSRLVLMVTAAIFVVVFSLLAYAIVKFRQNRERDG